MADSKKLSFSTTTKSRAIFNKLVTVYGVPRMVWNVDDYLEIHEKARVGVKLWGNLYLLNVSQFQDKQKCSCWQLTIQTTAASNPDAQVNANAGYEFRRLMEGVPTGIYECNKFCKCNNTCLNRVAQNPIRIPLQVFKTDRRGWGIRTLCDIPRGENLVIFERERA